MTGDSSSRSGSTNRRGLATVAFLKAQFDEGKDYLDMFQPLVEDEIRRYGKDDIDLPGFKVAVRESTGISIPMDILRTILQRATKHELLTRQGGRFLRRRGVRRESALLGRMEEFSRGHLRLARALREFAGSRDVELKSDEGALVSLMRFLDAHHIAVVIGQRITIESSDGFGRLSQAIAAFVKHTIVEGGELAGVLEGIVKGLIVHNALLLRDIPIAQKHLERLTVFLDSGVLLYALGHAGPAEEQAMTEGLTAVQDAGATLAVFERTVDEMESILQLYEGRLGSTAGVRSLRDTPLTRHFLGIQATPADIRQEIALMRPKLAGLGIGIQGFPEYVPKFTEDESALAEFLKNPKKEEGADERRIWHDVRAVSAVITLRRGARPGRIFGASFVFASGSSPAVASATRWYRKSYPEGLEPIVHFRAVTNAAWVLRPVQASMLPIQELVAVCSAVLEPSSDVWSRFVEHLEKLVKSGAVNDEESVAVLAHHFTRIKLGDFDSPDDVEATTVLDIVERVREEVASPFRSQLEEKEREAEQTRSALADARAENLAIKSRAKAQTDRIAACLAGLIYGAFCLALLVGAARTLPLPWPDWTQPSSIWGVGLWACLLAFYGVALLDIFSERFRLVNVFERLRVLIARGIEKIGTPRGKSGAL